MHVEADYNPNVDFRKQPIRNAADYDVLSAFIEACQAKLERGGISKPTRNASAATNRTSF